MSSPGIAPRPTVSILLAVRNESSDILACLATIAAQRYPHHCLDLIVIDGASVDGTAARVQGWAVHGALPVTLLTNPRRSTPAAFNLGLSAARGEVVILLGARARLSPDFVALSVAALERTGADAVGGVVRSASRGGGVLGRAISLAQRSPFGVGNARYRYAEHEAEVDTVNYGAYRRAVFERIGGFDEAMQWVEDDEFNYRLRKAGGRLVLDPAIQVTYLARPTLAGLWRQRFRWGRGKPLVAWRHPAQMQPRHLAPAAFVLALAVGLALRPFGGRLRWPLRGTVSAYALATLAAMQRLGAREGWPRETALLPLPFATMHLAYGLGTLVGLADLARGAFARQTAQ